MVKTLHAIGTISSRISSADGRRVELVRAVDGRSVGAEPTAVDPVSAAAQALAEPMNYPPLPLSTVPGDRVAIAVDSAVPCAAEIVRGVVDALHRAGVEDDAISIVTTGGEIAQRCKAGLDSDAAMTIHSVTHDPDDENNLCLVGVPKRREPLRINRTIYDADVVLPIGCARVENRGPYDGLFPSFAGAEAVDRYRTPAGHDTAASQADMVCETDEAGWLIGVPLVVTVVPGANETVAGVVAGEPRATAQHSDRLCREQWALRSPQRASLVIATLGGGPAAQTWENVGRALAAAERLVEEDGAVAICTNLDEPPGPSLGRLIGSPDLAATERQIAEDHSKDSWPAWQLARALRRGPVYFLGLLDAETIEEMGMAPVADVEEIVRLAGRCTSCIVLDDAQHAVAIVDGEADDV